jgi:hypothetical protein
MLTACCNTNTSSSSYSSYSGSTVSASVQRSSTVHFSNSFSTPLLHFQPLPIRATRHVISSSLPPTYLELSSGSSLGSSPIASPSFCVIRLPHSCRPAAPLLLLLLLPSRAPLRLLLLLLRTSVDSVRPSDSATVSVRVRYWL